MAMVLTRTVRNESEEAEPFMKIPAKEHPVEVTDLYRDCLTRERTFLAIDFRKLKLKLGWHTLLFSYRFFEDELSGKRLTEKPHCHSKSDQLTRIIVYGCRYRDLLGLLRETKNKEARLLVLAAWLRYERLLEPEDILPPQLIQKWRFKGISLTDLRHARLVEIWRPYFRQLFADRKALEKTARRSKEALLARGYEESAILATLGKREIVPAICEWLADRGVYKKGIDAQTLRNAHSRIFRSKPRLHSNSGDAE